MEIKARKIKLDPLFESLVRTERSSAILAVKEDEGTNIKICPVLFQENM